MPERLLLQIEKPHDERTPSRLARIAIAMARLNNNLRYYLTARLIGPVIEPDLSKPLFNSTGEISEEQPEEFRKELERTRLTTPDSVIMFDSPYTKK